MQFRGRLGIELKHDRAEPTFQFQTRRVVEVPRLTVSHFRVVVHEEDARAEDRELFGKDEHRGFAAWRVEIPQTVNDHVHPLDKRFPFDAHVRVIKAPKPIVLVELKEVDRAVHIPNVGQSWFFCNLVHLNFLAVFSYAALRS